MTMVPPPSGSRPMSPFSTIMSDSILEVDISEINEISEKQAEALRQQTEAITNSAYQQAMLLQQTFAKLAENDMSLASQMATVKQKIRANHIDVSGGVHNNAVAIEELRQMAADNADAAALMARLATMEGRMDQLAAENAALAEKLETECGKGNDLKWDVQVPGRPAAACSCSLPGSFC